MPDFPKLPIITPPKSPFPDLPIITPDPPRLSMAEKYGGLYYFGVIGLFALAALVIYFGYGIWASREFWGAVIVVHDESRPEADRIKAAWIVAHHPTGNDRQKSDIALEKGLPSLIRYIVAEGIGADAIQVDPKAYALMVAKSEDWPPWLRLLMSRPMAYGVGEGYRIAWEPLDLLRAHPDPAIALWATYTRAVNPPGDASAKASLAEFARRPGPFQGLAERLDVAARSEGPGRTNKLDEATAWLRLHHPESAKLWEGWEERDGKIVERPTAKPGA